MLGTHFAGGTPPSVSLGTERPAVEVSDVAIRWLCTLPKECRPIETGRLYPHIVNKLAVLWDAPDLLHPFFDSLFIDQRGDRQGFQPAVLFELFRLRDYRQQAGSSRESYLLSGAEPTCPWATQYLR